MVAEKWKVTCVNPESERILLSKEHALIGISPFNGYYVQSNLEKLFSWGLSNFKEMNVFIPDEISLYTLQAVGYSENKAKKKISRQDRYLKSKAIKALVANGLSEKEAIGKIIFLSSLANNEKYMRFYNACNELYEKDKNFKDGCLATSKWVLASKGIYEIVNDEAVNIAVKYFLAELPLYLNASDILNVSSSLFIYKDSPPDFLKKIYASGGPLVSCQQGYAAVNYE